MRQWNKLYLVRHGDGIVRKPCDEALVRDTGLSKLGHEQAARLAERVISLNIGRIVCSPLPRARTTAEIIARASALTVEPVRQLREVEPAENASAFKARVHAALEGLGDGSGATCLIVSHGGVISEILMRLVGREHISWDRDKHGNAVMRGELWVIERNGLDARAARLLP
jgi:broad specificity phosphatase PhoE